MKNSKGFTLVEILIVLSIISVLFVVLIPQVNSSFNKTHEAGIRTDFRSFQQSSESYMRESSGKNLKLNAFNSYFDSDHKIVEVDGLLQSNKLDPFKTNYGVQIDDRKVEFFSHGDKGDKNTKEYRLIVYYYKGFVDSCTIGFATQNLMLSDLTDSIEGFDCGDDLPIIAPAPEPPAPPVIPAPISPTNFYVSGTTATSVSLSWNLSQHATKYVLKRDGITIYTGSSSSFTNSSLSPYTAYSYSLTAENDKGVSSPINVVARTMPTDETVKLPNEGSGSCSPYNPYIIRTIGELQGIQLGLSSCYVLGNNINASLTNTWNNGKGFLPIQDSGFYFEGQLDGKGFVIDNLFINRPTEDWVAMFNALGVNAKVTGVNMTNSNISGKDYVGTLAAYIYDGGVLRATQVSGKLQGNSVVGGVIGFNEGTISNSSCTCNITAKSEAGGIVGSNYGLTENNSTLGAIQTVGIHTGGIIGFNGETGIVRSSNSEATVKGSSYIGGAVGFSNGITENLDTTTSVSGEEHVGGVIGFNGEEGITYNLISQPGSSVVGTSMVGGIAGYNEGFMEVSESHATVKAAQEVGGVVGTNDGVIEYSESFASIQTSLQGGGIVGVNNGSVRIATSNATFSEAGNMIGGIAGYNEEGALVSDTSSISPVNGAETVGGVVGFNAGTLESSRMLSDVKGTFQVGGLIGFNNIAATATSISSTSTATVTGIDRVGGVVGYNDGELISSESHARVIGKTNVGGLVGENEGNISNTFSRSSVNGENNVGGLVGRSYIGTIRNSYASGVVSGLSNTGGLIGENVNAPVHSSYYDSTTSGQNDTGKGVGRTTAQMKTKATYSGWDFVLTWDINAAKNNGYPTIKTN